ncbi:hypothetical protein GCM10007927_16710 [Sulfitobacter pacificus]|uniref:Uncharacterized protein n=1 Tax=Sulfitobacter pacificus TaxID=1499314 RepID=A0ABQ5VID9_9RHOB|nr:hypothetical protein GCM10007927_16710 [Sulfitobacter pacificus]
MGNTGWRRIRQPDGFKCFKGGIVDCHHIRLGQGFILSAFHTRADRSQIGGKWFGTGGAAGGTATAARKRLFCHHMYSGSQWKKGRAVYPACGAPRAARPRMAPMVRQTLVMMQISTRIG